MKLFDKDNITQHNKIDIDTTIDEVIDSMGLSYRVGDLKEDISDRKINSVLYSLNPHDRLNPKIWSKDDEIDKRVRLRLLQIADEFIKFLNIKWVKPIDIILTGSLANYNWSRYSDFDLHILMDFNKVDKRVDFVREYFNSKKNIWNSEHEDLNIYGYPIELYVQDANEKHDATGIYSLEREKWLKKPKHKKEKDEINKKKVKSESIKFIRLIDKLIVKSKYEKDEHKLETLKDDSNKLYDAIYDMRKKSLNNAGEYGDGNIVFKVLRRLDYINKLRTLNNELFDKTNSIEK